jgi:hypothetical protein
MGKEGAYPFSGLLWNAASGPDGKGRREPFYIASAKYKGRSTRRFLVNANGIEGTASCTCFPLVTFERAILSRLREIKPHEILKQHAEPDETAILEGELAGVEAELCEAKAYMDRKGFSVSIADHITTLEDRKRDLDKRLHEARQKAAHPLPEAWSEFQTLLGVLDSAQDPEDTRLRLRAALRRIVSQIWLLVTHRGRDSLAVVQVWFQGGERSRDYLIIHRPPKANGKARQLGRWLSISFACPTLAARGCVPDLRQYWDDPTVRDWFEQHMAKMIPAADKALAADKQAREALAAVGDSMPSEEDLAPHLYIGTVD